MDPTAYYNSMQQSAGLMPPQVIFPGQVSAAIAAQGGVGAFGSLFPSQTYQTAVGSPPIFQGPTGLMAQINPSAPYNPYAAQNPYSGLSAYGAFRGTPSPFAPYAPNPPPAYAGFQGPGALPFAPAPAPGAFDTPYGAQLAQAQALQDRSWIRDQAAKGFGARAGTDFAMAGAGAMLGKSFGAWGALAGGVAGFLGSEVIGFGRGAQNTYGSWVTSPQLAEYGAAGGIEHLSRGFISGGASMHASGQGFSHHAALDASRSLTALANSSSFRQDTRDRFNQQDLYRITQNAADSGLMTGVGSTDQFTHRVKDVAKSLSSFMELAKEPDIVRAIQTMGSLRSSGLNLQETMSAVSAGRTFARMAGTSFQGLAELGGSMGSQAFQSMGLSQGLGFQAGMSNYGQAVASINRGILSPQLAALTGGAQGLGTLNSMFSGAMLQMPMMAPGMMSAGGGLSASNVQGLLSGRANLFNMTGQGASTLSGMTERYGVGGLGMAVAMQPLLQDTLGRMLQSQGPFAQRNTEDRQILALAQQMGLSGSQGFLTAAQTLGMDRNQALIRATELGSTSYWEGQRSQLRVNQREARANRERELEDSEPSVLGSVYRTTAVGSAFRAVRNGAHRMGVTLSEAFGGEESLGIYGSFNTEDARRRVRRAYGSQSYLNYVNQQESGAPRSSGSFFGDSIEAFADTMNTGYRYSRLNGASSLGAGFAAFGRLFSDSEADRRQQLRSMQNGAVFASNVMGATAGQRREAMGRVDTLFGGSAGFNAFSTSMTELGNDYGGRVNRVTSITRPLSLIPGLSIAASASELLTGSRGMDSNDIYSRYRQSMRANGMSDDQIRTNWEQNRGDIATALGADLEARGMTPEARAAWEQTQRGVRGNTGSQEAGQRRVRAAYERVLGHAGAEGREGYDAIMGEVRGIGREGTAGYERTRKTIGVLSMLNVLQSTGGGRGATETERRRADAIYNQLTSGMSPQERALVGQRVTAEGARFRDNDSALTAARGLLSGDPSTVLDRVSGLENVRTNEKALRDAQTGFALMGHQGGVLGEALRQVEGGNRDRSLEALRRLTPDQLDRLRRERGGARVAALIERGDMRGVEAIAGSMGEGGDAARRRWDEEHSTLRRIGSTFGLTSFLDSQRERSVLGELAPRSSAEREASLQGRDSASAQSEAEGSGMGRASDALLEASRELREAAERISSSESNRALGSMVNP